MATLIGLCTLAAVLYLIHVNRRLARLAIMWEQWTLAHEQKHLIGYYGEDDEDSTTPVEIDEDGDNTVSGDASYGSYYDDSSYGSYDSRSYSRSEPSGQHEHAPDAPPASPPPRRVIVRRRSESPAPTVSRPTEASGENDKAAQSNETR